LIESYVLKTTQECAHSFFVDHHHKPPPSYRMPVSLREN
jgi:hypothetical protein